MPDLLRIAADLYRAGWLAEAEAGCRRALELAPNDPAMLRLLAAVLEDEGRLAEAREAIEQALARAADSAEAHKKLGDVLAAQGLIDEAVSSYRTALRLRPDYVAAYSRLGHLRSFAADGPEVAALERLVAQPGLGQDDRAKAAFTLFKAYDDSGDCERAFDRLSRANRWKRELVSYDGEAESAAIERIRRVFEPALLDRLGGLGYRSQLPVFVLGMPRSGTTLVEQILASHPQVHGAGELFDVPRLATAVASLTEVRVPFPDGVGLLDAGSLTGLGRSYVEQLATYAPAAARIVDKLPASFLYVGLLELILPEAAIVHTVRDPAATCFSCFSLLFANHVDYSYDLVELGAYYRAYARLMAHWRAVLPDGRLLEVRYEDVVSDLEGTARRLIAHCGLEWDDACLAFHRTKRAVQTASMAQVRRPLYTTSVERWRRYERQLGPLLAELRTVG